MGWLCMVWPCIYVRSTRGRDSRKPSSSLQQYYSRKKTSVADDCKIKNEKKKKI